jgi:hypothetical protein
MKNSLNYCLGARNWCNERFASASRNSPSSSQTRPKCTSPTSSPLCANPKTRRLSSKALTQSQGWSNVLECNTSQKLISLQSLRRSALNLRRPTLSGNKRAATCTTLCPSVWATRLRFTSQSCSRPFYRQSRTRRSQSEMQRSLRSRPSWESSATMQLNRHFHNS